MFTPNAQEWIKFSYNLCVPILQFCVVKEIRFRILDYSLPKLSDSIQKKVWQLSSWYLSSWHLSYWHLSSWHLSYWHSNMVDGAEKVWHSSPWHLSSWHLSGLYIYSPTYTHPPIVGMIYPIPTYIFKNVYSTTLRPKGAQKPYNLHSSPKCWHDIFNTNIYIQICTGCFF